MALGPRERSVRLRRAPAARPSAVDHPAHYNAGKIEVIDFIEDQGLGFHLGNVVKYVCRAESGLVDLEKARWYLTREIQKRRWPDLTSKQAQEKERSGSSKREGHRPALQRVEEQGEDAWYTSELSLGMLPGQGRR